MNKLIILSCLLITTFSDLYRDQKISDKTSKTEFNILFVGNSLTYTNNLPKLIKKNAKSQGIKIDYKMIAFPDYALVDHWKDGEIQKLIASKKYDFVIIQQGPSSQIDGRNMLIEYGKKFSSLCKLNGTKLCYFMVWPSLNYYHTFDGVIKNYTDAASINNAILLPVGEVWKEYFDRTGNFGYYGPDGFHPSLEGSKTAAKVIVNSLFLNKKGDVQQSFKFDIATEFIDAFYSFNRDSLQSTLTYADESQHSILYYQKWAECGNYKVIKRNDFIIKNDSLLICPITVKDDLIGALEVDFNVTDTFHLTIINEKIRSIKTSSNDPDLFYEAKDWIKQNRPELIEKACDGPSTPCECVNATVKGFIEFKKTNR